MLLTKPRFALWRAAAVLLFAVPLSGCGVGYVAQAARGQLAVMRARQPIARVLERPDTSPGLREQLQRAQRIREFASLELGLPDNAAFRSYADIGRRYVVWNVVATPELSMTPRQWCFPIAGCVAYRGYFHEAAARAYAAQLAARGDDVVVGGVPAYSTLGRTADPILSTVAGYSELDLAALIFHELAHQVLYVPGDSAFNEAFATAVEEVGVTRYAARYVDAAQLARWHQRRALRQQVIAEFSAARARLAALYASAASDDEKRRGKQAALAALATRVREIEAAAGQPSGYGAWIDAGLNNAYLASVATYYEGVPRLLALLEQDCGGYLPCFYLAALRAATQSR
ncbi:MAG: aminopeptidase [Steroidobacteraceae bacterium]